MNIKKDENMMADHESVILTSQKNGINKDYPETVQPGEQNCTAECSPEKTDAAAEDALRREMMALLERYPELHERLKCGESMPQEVLIACAKEGISLQVAYAEYEMKQAQAQADQLRRELELLRQNAAVGGRAPVKGATLGGSTAAKARDPFLEGLLGDE